MKMNKFPVAAFLVMLMLLASSCSLVEGIFKAGVWVGVLIVVAIIGGVFWLITRLGKK
jgi:hypothetical protein